MDKIDIFLISSSLVTIILAILFNSNIITYYLLIPILIIPFTLIGYRIYKSTILIDTLIRSYVRYSYENPYYRKRALIKGALEGSTMARISIGEIIKEAYERKYNVKLNEENAFDLIRDQDVVALLFYKDFENYFQDSKKYEYSLKKAIDMVW